MADYLFRDDIEADKQRKADAEAANGVATLAASAPVAPAQPVALNPYGDLAKAAQAIKPAPTNGEKPDYFADFRASLDSQDPFKQKLAQNVNKTLDNPYAGFDAGASAQKDMLGNEIAAEGERRRVEAIRNSGGQQGMAEKAAGAFQNTAIMQQAALGRDLAAGRAQAGEAARSNAIGQGLQLTGQQDQVTIAGKQLAETARQFNTQQEFTEFATKEGWNQDAIARAWQSSENTKAQSTTKEIAYAQIGSSERMQQSTEAHDTAMKDLDRSLEKLLSNDRIRASFDLAALDQTFQDKMSEKGFLHTKELEGMKATLAETLQAKGFDHDTAVQIAEQKFQVLKAENDQVFQEKMTGINQKFVTGERVSTQEWEGSMKSLDQRHADLMQERAQLHEKGMQTDRIDAEIVENSKTRASQELMAAAQLASSDSHFHDELMQKYDISEQEMGIRRTEMEANLGILGLQGEQLKGAIADSKVKSAMDIAALGMEIGNGSAEAMAPFVEQFGAALSGYMKEQGIDISKSDFVKAMTTHATTGTTSQKDAAKTFDSILDSKGGFSTPEKADEIKQGVKDLTTSYASASPGKVVSLSTGNGADFDAAIERLKGKGLTSFDGIVSRDRVGEFSKHYEYEGTQAFADYTAFTKLLNNGLSLTDAQDALSSLVGPNRATAAFSLEVKK